MNRTLLICTPCHHLHGGVERIIEALHDGLPRHGFRVVVGLAKGERFHRPERFLQEYPNLESVEIDGLSGRRPGRVRGLRRALEQVRPDVVLVARLFDAYAAVAERKLRGDPVRLATTIQAYEPEYLADLAVYADFIDLCVTSGNLIARAVEHFTSVPPERVYSIPGGVCPATRYVEHDDARPLRLGYVGRLDQEQKRVLDLVDTLLALTTSGVQFSCRVAGAGPMEGPLRARLGECGLEKRVQFDGWKTTGDLYKDVYPELDVLLHFAAWEGITIAPREAMAHGAVPVVSRFRGCLAEGQFRDEEAALLFDVGQTASAAECVRRLHGDRLLLRRLSANARRSQEGICSEQGALAAWAERFRDALECPARIGSTPSMPWPPSGRLERWGLPASWSEALRRWSGRTSQHTGPGGEWPHCSGLADAGRLREIIDYAADYEDGLAHGRA